jgi:hypothetical protein
MGVDAAGDLAEQVFAAILQAEIVNGNHRKVPLRMGGNNLPSDLLKRELIT